MSGHFAVIKDFFKMLHDCLVKILSLCEGTAITTGAQCAFFDEKISARCIAIISVPMPNLEEIKRSVFWAFKLPV